MAVLAVGVVLASVAMAQVHGWTAAGRVVAHGLPGSPVVKKTAREIVQLGAQNHRPKIGVRWKYQVQATTRSGRALGGKVLTEFRTVVTTKYGSVTLNWPVKAVNN